MARSRVSRRAELLRPSAQASMLDGFGDSRHRRPSSVICVGEAPACFVALIDGNHVARIGPRELGNAGRNRAPARWREIDRPTRMATRPNAASRGVRRLRGVLHATGWPACPPMRRPRIRGRRRSAARPPRPLARGRHTPRWRQPERSRAPERTGEAWGSASQARRSWRFEPPRESRRHDGPHLRSRRLLPA